MFKFICFWALFACLVDDILGHGMLMYPPARNTMWRAGFNIPKDWNDMGLNCGGTPNSGKCGLCGDPYGGTREHEAGGKYAPINRPTSLCVKKASHTIPINVRITSFHKGYFEFRLCVNNDMTRDPGQECLDNGYLLTVAGTQQGKYDIANNKRENYTFELDIPQGVTCTQCILQWTYTAGNNYGCVGNNCGVGIGPQENFINCADIAILDDCSTLLTGSSQKPITSTHTTTQGLSTTAQRTTPTTGVPSTRPTTTHTASTTSPTTASTSTPSTTSIPTTPIPTTPTTTTTPSTTPIPTTPSTTPIPTTPSTTPIPTTPSTTPIPTTPSTTPIPTTPSTTPIPTTPSTTPIPTTPSTTPIPTTTTTTAAAKSTPHSSGKLVCGAKPAAKVYPHMDDWCRQNCLHLVVKYCPPSHCVCHRV